MHTNSNGDRVDTDWIQTSDYNKNPNKSSLRGQDFLNKISNARRIYVLNEWKEKQFTQFTPLPKGEEKLIQTFEIKIKDVTQWYNDTYTHYRLHKQYYNSTEIQPNFKMVIWKLLDLRLDDIIYCRKLFIMHSVASQALLFIRHLTNSISS